MKRKRDWSSFVGEKFCRLTVLSISAEESGSVVWFNVKCDCGTIKKVRASLALSGRTKSCGCLCREATSIANKKHGASRTPLHNIWKTMRQRCNNCTSVGFRWYGARGVHICEEWDDFLTFSSWAFKNGYSEGLSIDRIDPRKPYSPANCRWVSRSENSGRVNQVIISANGHAYSLSEWGRVLNIKPRTVRAWHQRHGKEYTTKKIITLLQGTVNYAM